VSEESCTGAPETAAPVPPPEAGAPADTEQADASSPESLPPGRWLRALPPWLRRWPVVAAFGVGILVVAALIVVAVQPSAERLKYTGMPAPCGVLTAATMAKYLPGAISQPQNGSQVSTCNWSSDAGGQDAVLSVTIDIYRSSSWLDDAQVQYQSTRSEEAGIFGKGSTVSTRPVTGLGDQAVSMIVIGTPGPDEGVPPQIGLVVQSSNADIWLNYSTMPIGSAAALPITAQVAGTITMARDILAALAHAAVHGAGRASPATSAPLPAGPQYTTPRNACALVKASTLEKYAPHTPAGYPGTAQSPPGCIWATSRGSLQLNLTFADDSFAAQSDLEYQLEVLRLGGSGSQFTGAQPVTGLGQQATATFQIVGGEPAVWLDVWSGNAEIEFEFEDLASDPALSKAEKLTAEIAMTRDVLASLPRYTPPRSA
jgi:hypothetical protein